MFQRNVVILRYIFNTTNMLLYSIILIISFAICCLIFGKADTKREVLQVVGLDLSEQNYKTKKEIEYEKYCIKALYNAVDRYNCIGKNEKEFLDVLYNSLFKADINHEYLMVSNHYVKQAYVVVFRRIKALESDSKEELVKNCNFTLKKDIKRYINKLWEKYQYPWPSDWLQIDSSL